MNPAAERAPFGRPASELLGKVIWDVFPSIPGTRIHQHYLDAIEKRSREHYEAQSPLNGRWYEVFMFPRTGGLDVYMRDITERKRAEEALRESESRFRSVLDQSLNAIYRLNLKTGSYEYFSPAFTQVVGRSPEEVASQGAERTMEWIHQDDLPGVRAALARLGESGAVEIDYRLRDASGDYRWVSNHLSQTWDSSGEPRYRDGAVRDITTQKQAEEALRESDLRSAWRCATLRCRLQRRTASSSTLGIQPADGAAGRDHRPS